MSSSECGYSSQLVLWAEEEICFWRDPVGSTSPREAA